MARREHMTNQPSAQELLEAVRDFLEQRVLPEVSEHTAFHTRVAVNALGIVARELAVGGTAEEEERARLTRLVGYEGTRDALDRELCRRIRAGEIGTELALLRAHLERTASDRVMIDQPDYAGRARNAPAG